MSQLWFFVGYRLVMFSDLLEQLIGEEMERDKLLEQLASLEHDQWVMWASDILATEHIGDERVKRWRSLFVPYTQLSEEMKEKDREWARKVLEILEKNNERSN